MKDVSFSWNEMLFAMQKTDIHVLELFCRASHARASRHRITFKASKNTNAVFNATKQMQGHRCWKASFSVREICLMQFNSKSQVHERCFFLMKWNVICNAEDRFSGVRAFFAEQVMLELQCTESLVLELLRTLMLCLVQLSKWRECKATDAKKLLSQW